MNEQQELKALNNFQRDLTFYGGRVVEDPQIGRGFDGGVTSIIFPTARQFVNWRKTIIDKESVL